MSLVNNRTLEGGPKAEQDANIIKYEEGTQGAREKPKIFNYIMQRN